LNGTDQQQERIDAAAAAWIARLAGEPLTRDERRDLDLWVAANPRHAAAFEEARIAWALMGRAGVVPGIPVDESLALPRRTARRDRWTWGAAAAALVVMVAGALLWFGDPMVMMAADHSTGPAERRVVALSDGSIVELGPASAIAVRFSTAERRVALLSGVAFFHPAPLRDAEQRPFLVNSAGGSARALGTQFVVERLSQAVEVTVIEHQVVVRAEAATDREGQVVLSAGQSVRYVKDGLQAVRAVSADAAMAWRDGRLLFDNVTLLDVVTELGRYRRGKIVIAAPGLAARAVSGVFDTTDSGSALDTICRELGVRMISVSPLVTILY